MIDFIFPDIRKRLPYFGQRWLDSKDLTGGFEPINWANQPYPQGFSFAVSFSGDSLSYCIIDLIFSDIRSSLLYLVNAGGIVKT